MNTRRGLVSSLSTYRSKEGTCPSGGGGGMGREGHAALTKFIVDGKSSSCDPSVGGRCCMN
jgi:hypothetical protein